jgi:hypothetical protein
LPQPPVVWIGSGVADRADIDALHLADNVVLRMRQIS